MERQVPLRVRVVAEDVRDLLEDQDDADRGEQPLDDAGREEGGQKPGPGHAQDDLDDPGDDDGQEERLVRPEEDDLGGDDGRQPGGRPADARVRPAQEADQDAADDPGDQPGEQRDVQLRRDEVLGRGRRQGDAQAQRQGDQEDDQAGGQVANGIETRRSLRVRHAVILIVVRNRFAPVSRQTINVPFLKMAGKLDR